LAAALSLEPDVLVLPEFPKPELLLPGRMAWTGATGGSNRRGILVYADHAFTGDAQGGERKPTFQHMGSRHGTYHIDYCFIPKQWASRLISVDVGSVKGWRRLSDHAPLVVDVSLS